MKSIPPITPRSYYFDHLFQGTDGILLSKLRQGFLAGAEKYLFSKGKIAPDGRYQLKHKQSCVFTLDEEISSSKFSAACNYVPLSVPTIRLCLDYIGDLRPRRARSLLILSELADIRPLRSWVRFDAVCSGLHLCLDDEKRNFAQVTFQEDYSNNFSTQVYDNWEVNRKFLFDVICYFYDGLPPSWQGKKDVAPINFIEKRDAIIHRILAGEEVDISELDNLYLPLEKAQSKILSWNPKLLKSKVKNTLSLYNEGHRDVSLSEFAAAVVHLRGDVCLHTGTDTNVREYTLSDVQDLTGLTRQRVNQLVHEGRICATKIGLYYRVDSEEFKRLEGLFLADPLYFRRTGRKKRACLGSRSVRPATQNYETIFSRRLRKFDLSSDIQSIDDITIEQEALLATKYINTRDNDAFELLARLYAPKIAINHTGSEEIQKIVTLEDKVHFARIGLFFALCQKIQQPYSQSMREIIINEMRGAVKTLRANERGMILWNARRLDAPMYREGGRSTLHERLAVEE